MIDLLLAAALLQPVDPCFAVGETPAGCPAWRSLFRGNGGEMFVEPAALNRDGDRFQVRVRVLFEQPAENGARTVLGTYRYDCRARTALMLHFSSYDAGGRQLEDGAPGGPAAQTQAIEDGTPNAAVLAAFCRS